LNSGLLVALCSLILRRSLRKKKWTHTRGSWRTCWR